MRSPDELTTRFRERGMKVTPQRLAVFEALYGDGGHPTADVVWERVREQMSTVSLRTVYQVLNDLVDMGEVETVDVGNGGVRFDPNVSDHDHFVCLACERVYDVQSTRPSLVSTVPGHGRSLEGENGEHGDAAHFTVEEAEVIFRGLCPSCRS